MEDNGLTSWWTFHFQGKYESLGGNLDVCSRFLMDIGANIAFNLYIDE